MKPEESTLKEIEAQLSHPKGEQGIAIGEKMNTSNMPMTLNSIDFMNVKDKDKVLEIGHGNCGHLEALMAEADDLYYSGVEISETMYDEAQRINKENIQKAKAEFKIYDGLKLPFPSDAFDKSFTVNTIYFWQKPEEFLKEIKRVLKPEGVCVITFVRKETMVDLPFVKNKFRIYEIPDIERLAASAQFQIAGVRYLEDQVTSKSGEMILRKYAVVRLVA
ncbi:MAG: class I SAM-dependent methyltransferase [Bacteroidota bacterium]